MPVARPPNGIVRRGVVRLILALALGAAGARTAAAEPQVLRVSLNTELQLLDPIVTTINATRVFAYMVFDMLVGIDNEGHYHPQMLEGWQISGDRLSYTFRLRDGLFWSDGAPVTADDCVASIRRWAKRESFGMQLMRATQDLRVVDARTFELHLNQPFAFVIDALGKPGNAVPVIMPARIAAFDATKQVPEIVRSGPFLFRHNEWRPGELAVFDRNPNYHPRAEPADGLSGGKLVKLDRVELLSVPDQATRVAALQKGELDYLEIVPFDFIDELRRDPAIAIPSQRGVEQIMSIVTLNHLQPPFNNPLVRRAAQAAINQEDVMGALGLPSDMFMRECHSIYMCDVTCATHPARPTRGPRFFAMPVWTMRVRCCVNQVTTTNRSWSCTPPARPCSIRLAYCATVAQRRQSRAPVGQGGWSVVPIIWNGIDLVNPLSDPAVSNNCNEFNPGWYCDPAQTGLLHRFSEAATDAVRTQLAGEIQAAFHHNVNVLLGGQFSAPPAYRSNLHGVIPFGFPVFWSMQRQ
jgi:peptide/nickel transport system substrate-binding protein